MTSHRPAAIVLLAAFLAGSGCTALRELPRSEYASKPQRNHVRVETVDGLVYEFDYIQVAGDSLTGFREREQENSTIAEFGALSIPFDQV